MRHSGCFETFSETGHTIWLESKKIPDIRKEKSGYQGYFPYRK